MPNAAGRSVATSTSVCIAVHGGAVYAAPFHHHRSLSDTVRSITSREIPETECGGGGRRSNSERARRYQQMEWIATMEGPATFGLAGFVRVLVALPLLVHPHLASQLNARAHVLRVLHYSRPRVLVHDHPPLLYSLRVACV